MNYNKSFADVWHNNRFFLITTIPKNHSQNEIRSNSTKKS